MKTLILICLLIVNPVYAVDVFVGLGVHSEKYDCPEVCYGGNTLAIVEIKQDLKPLQVKFIHISNPEIKEKGHGTNAIFLGFEF